MKALSPLTIFLHLTSLIFFLPSMAQDDIPHSVGKLHTFLVHSTSEELQHPQHGGHKMTGRKTKVASSNEKSAYLKSKLSLLNPNKGMSIYFDDESRHPGDTFICDKCLCSYNDLREIVANCTYKVGSHFPSRLPADTRIFSLEGSAVRWLNMSQFSVYPSLSKVTVSKNTRFLKIHNSSLEARTLPVTYLDLSFNNIDSIDGGSFKLMPWLETLNLAYNNITHITKYTFMGIPHLQCLNLSSNNIQHIDDEAFDNLKSLRILDFCRQRQNKLYESLPPRLFENIKNLQVLNIAGFFDVPSWYPRDILPKLTTLEKLTVSGHPTDLVFAPEIRMLKYLNHIELVGARHAKCSIPNITDTFFENLQNLQSLRLYRCNSLTGIQVTKSSLLTTFTTLKITDTIGYTLLMALRDLESFQNSSLRSLSLIALRNQSDSSICRTLRQDHAKYLKGVHLEELDISSNNIAVISDAFLKELPPTLKRLNLQGNKLSAHHNKVNLDYVQFLEEIDISYQNMPNLYSTRKEKERDKLLSPECWEREYDPFETNRHCSPQQNIKSSMSTENLTIHVSNGDSKLIYNNFSPSFRAPSTQGSEVLLQKFMSRYEIRPSWQTFRASYFYSFGASLLQKDMVSLKDIDLSSSSLSRLHKLVMPPGTVKADLSGNYFKVIGAEFFTPNNSLANLSLRDNLFGPIFADDKSGMIFSNLERTVYLDLSTNTISELPELFFAGLKSLRVLKLSDNKLKGLKFRLDHMKSLRFLDLSKNSITWISKNTRNDLDIIASNHILDVDITESLLLCTCEGLDMLHWMANTNVYFLHKDFLKCRLEDGNTVKLGNLEERVLSLQRQCATKGFIIVICIASILVLGLLVGFALLYRFRWKFRYLKNIALARLAGFTPRQEHAVRYKFDAFVIYTEESRNFVLRDCLQELEVNRGHKLCVEDRDFMPGTFVFSDIISAIQNSTKTVVIVTPDLYEGDFSEYGVKMAVMEEIHQRRSALHLCVLQPMPDEEMSQCHDLLMVMNRNDYTEFPPENEANDEIRRNFWEQLSQAIGHVGNEEVEALLRPI